MKACDCCSRASSLEIFKIVLQTFKFDDVGTATVSPHSQLLLDCLPSLFEAVGRLMGSPRALEHADTLKSFMNFSDALLARCPALLLSNASVLGFVVQISMACTLVPDREVVR